MAKLLRQYGYDVCTADGYVTALAAAKQRKIDLLLCDIGLPDGDGCDLFRAIYASTPVEGIAVSGYGMPEEIDRCMAAGFRSHLLKPFDLDDLKSRVEEALLAVRKRATAE